MTLDCHNIKRLDEFCEAWLTNIFLIHSNDLDQLKRYASIFNGVDNTIDLLWLIPIKSDEMQYYREYGYKALIDKINELNVDISSLDRTSVV